MSDDRSGSVEAFEALKGLARLRPSTTALEWAGVRPSRCNVRYGKQAELGSVKGSRGAIGAQREEAFRGVLGNRLGKAGRKGVTSQRQ